MQDPIKLNNTLLRIHEMMAERNWTLYRLSKESGISYNTLRNLFARNSEPTLETTRRICDGLGISVSDLLTDTDIPLSWNQYTAEEKHLIRDYRSLTKKEKELLKIYLSGLHHILPD